MVVCRVKLKDSKQERRSGNAQEKLYFHFKDLDKMKILVKKQQTLRKYDV